MLESNNYFSKNPSRDVRARQQHWNSGEGGGHGRPSDVKYWRGLVGAIPQFLKICAQKDISVQHLGSGIYVLPMYPDKLETKKGEKVFGCVGSNILYLFRHCSHLKPFIDVLLFITSYSLYTLYITHTSDNEKVKKGKKEKEPFQTAKKEKVSCQLTLYTLCTLTTLYTLHTAQIFYTLTNVFWI